MIKPVMKLAAYISMPLKIVPNEFCNSIELAIVPSSSDVAKDTTIPSNRNNFLLKLLSTENHH